MSAIWPLHGDRRGMAAVEFAIILPVLLLLTAGAIEAGLMLMVDATLELAVRDGVRAGGIGDATRTRDTVISERIDQFMATWKGADGQISVEARAFPSVENTGRPEPFVDANDNGAFNVGETYSDVNRNRMWDSDMGTATDGGDGDIVLYTVTMTRSGFSGVLQLAGISTLTFTRRMTVVNE